MLPLRVTSGHDAVLGYTTPPQPEVEDRLSFRRRAMWVREASGRVGVRHSAECSRGGPLRGSQASFKVSPLLRGAGRPQGLLLSCTPRRGWEVGISG